MIYLITLSKDMAPLRVSQDHPFHSTVQDHGRAARVKMTMIMQTKKENVLVE